LPWRYRHSAVVKGLVNAEHARPVNIQFDNGTVRNTESASAASGVAPARVLPALNKGTLNVMRN
jgi:hypothetical protein